MILCNVPRMSGKLKKGECMGNNNTNPFNLWNTGNQQWQMNRRIYLDSLKGSSPAPFKPSDVFGPAQPNNSTLAPLFGKANNPPEWNPPSGPSFLERVTPNIPGKVLIILACVGCGLGFLIAAGSGSDSLMGALLGFVAGLIGIQLVVIAFHVALRVLL